VRAPSQALQRRAEPRLIRRAPAFRRAITSSPGEPPSAPPA
jgi:hypothetical protein